MTVTMLKMKIPIVLVFLILTCVLNAGKLSILIMLQPTGIIRPTDYTET